MTRQFSNKTKLALISSSLCLALMTATADSKSSLEKDRKAGRVASRTWDRRKASLAKARSAKLKMLNRKLGSWRVNERMQSFRDFQILGPKANDLLHKNLSSANGYLFRWSVLLLADSGSDKSYLELEKLFLNPKVMPPDRFYVLGSMANLAKAPNLEFFAEVVKTSESERSRLAAAVAYEKLVGPQKLATYLLTISSDQGNREIAMEQLRWLKRRTSGSSGKESEADLTTWAKAFKSELNEPPELKRVFGDGYVVVTDWLDTDEFRKLMIGAVDFRRKLAQWSEPGRRRKWTSHLHLFRSSGDFIRFGATREYNFYAFTEFYYSATNQEIVGFKDPDSKRLKRRLQHEFAHDVLGRCFGDLPPWLSEGLCEAFENVQFDDMGQWQKMPVQSLWRFLIQQAQTNNRLMSLEKLISLNATEFYGSNSSLNYATAWSFCHFLIEQKKEQGVTLIRQLLKDHRDLEKDKKLRGFRGAMKLSQLEVEWRKYVRRMKL